MPRPPTEPLLPQLDEQGSAENKQDSAESKQDSAGDKPRDKHDDKIFRVAVIGVAATITGVVVTVIGTYLQFRTGTMRAITDPEAGS